MKLAIFAGCLWAALTLSSGTRLAAAEDSIDYLQQIKPLLIHHCSSCHGGLQQKSGLRLDTASLVRTGGEGGAIVVPGDAAKSRLIEIVARTGDIKMPPAGDGTPLTAAPRSSAARV